MRYVRTIAIAALLVVGATGTGHAACDPKCTDGDVCRYNAEDDTYVCKAPPTKDRNQGMSTGPVRDQSSAPGPGTRLQGN